MLSKNQLGFLYMFLSICAFSLMDIIVKWSVNYPIGQVLFFRGFFGIIFYLLIIPKNRLHNFYITKRAGLHFLRCISGLIALVAIFIALRKLPLATVVSISFAAPIFTTILSIFLLSEKVGVYRWLAVVVGFIGILVITEPGISSVNIYYIFPIIFCLGLSYVAITLRQLSKTEPVWLISFYFSLSITILSFFTIPNGWVMPSIYDFILLSLVGIFGGVANLWLSTSYKYSEVSLVTPLKYLSLVFAIIFGYLIWNEIPTHKTLIGSILVITEPGISSVNIYYIFPIIFCLGLSYVAITLRQLSKTEPVWLISFYFSLSITILSFFTIPSGWIMPSLYDFILLSLVGLFGGVANLWLSTSYKYSEVSLVTPLKYLSLVFAIIFGYLIWNEIPTLKTLVGSILVILSTMIIFRREIYKKKIITSKAVHD